MALEILVSASYDSRQYNVDIVSIDESLQNRHDSYTRPSHSAIWVKLALHTVNLYHDLIHQISA